MSKDKINEPVNNAFNNYRESILNKGSVVEENKPNDSSNSAQNIENNNVITNEDISNLVSLRQRSFTTPYQNNTTDPIIFNTNNFDLENKSSIENTYPIKPTSLENKLPTPVFPSITSEVTLEAASESNITFNADNLSFNNGNIYFNNSTANVLDTLIKEDARYALENAEENTINRKDDYIDKNIENLAKNNLKDNTEYANAKLQVYNELHENLEKQKALEKEAKAAERKAKIAENYAKFNNGIDNMVSSINKAVSTFEEGTHKVVLNSNVETLASDVANAVKHGQSAEDAWKNYWNTWDYSNYNNPQDYANALASNLGINNNPAIKNGINSVFNPINAFNNAVSAYKNIGDEFTTSKWDSMDSALGSLENITDSIASGTESTLNLAKNTLDTVASIYSPDELDIIKNHKEKTANELKIIENHKEKTADKLNIIVNRNDYKYVEYTEKSENEASENEESENKASKSIYESYYKAGPDLFSNMFDVIITYGNNTDNNTNAFVPLNNGNDTYINNNTIATRIASIDIQLPKMMTNSASIFQEEIPMIGSSLDETNEGTLNVEADTGLYIINSLSSSTGLSLLGTRFVSTRPRTNKITMKVKSGALDDLITRNYKDKGKIFEHEGRNNINTFIFNDVKFIGAESAIEFKRDGTDIQVIPIKFIYKSIEYEKNIKSDGNLANDKSITFTIKSSSTIFEG